MMIAMVGQGVLTAVVMVGTMIVSKAKHNALVSVSDPLVLGFINLFAVGLAIAIGLLINRVAPRRAFPWEKIRGGAWLSLPLVGLGAAILMSEADNLFRYVCPPPEYIAKLMADLFLTQNRFFSLFFTLVIVAPLTEEFLFRGIILRGLLGRYRPAAAIGLSAMLFALMHLNPWQPISAFTLGVIFGWFYLRTGSIWPGVIGHAINNGIVVVLSAAPFGWWEVPTATDFQKVEFQSWWFDLIGAAMFGLGVWLFRRSTPVPPADDTEPLLPPVLPPTEPVMPA